MFLSSCTWVGFSVKYPLMENPREKLPLVREAHAFFGAILRHLLGYSRLNGLFVKLNKSLLLLIVTFVPWSEASAQHCWCLSSTGRVDSGLLPPRFLCTENAWCSFRNSDRDWYDDEVKIYIFQKDPKQLKPLGRCLALQKQMYLKIP